MGQPYALRLKRLANGESGGWCDGHHASFGLLRAGCVVLECALLQLIGLSFPADTPTRDTYHHSTLTMKNDHPKNWASFSEQQHNVQDVCTALQNQVNQNMYNILGCCIAQQQHPLFYTQYRTWKYASTLLTDETPQRRIAHQ